MCAWSRPMAAKRMECLGFGKGATLATSDLTAPEAACPNASGDTADAIPASPACRKNERRSVPLIGHIPHLVQSPLLLPLRALHLREIISSVQARLRPDRDQGSPACHARKLRNSRRVRGPYVAKDGFGRSSYASFACATASCSV